MLTWITNLLYILALRDALIQKSGIEPATFRFVAQHLNHCATAVRSRSTWKSILWVRSMICGNAVIFSFSSGVKNYRIYIYVQHLATVVSHAGSRVCLIQQFCLKLYLFLLGCFVGAAPFFFYTWMSVWRGIDYSIVSEKWGGLYNLYLRRNSADIDKALWRFSELCHQFDLIAIFFTTVKLVNGSVIWTSCSPKSVALCWNIYLTVLEQERLQWSSGSVLTGLWYPSSWVQTRPKPSDF